MTKTNSRQILGAIYRIYRQRLTKLLEVIVCQPCPSHEKLGGANLAEIQQRITKIEYNCFNHFLFGIWSANASSTQANISSSDIAEIRSSAYSSSILSLILTT